MKKLLIILIICVLGASFSFGQSKTKLKEVVVRPEEQKVVLGTRREKADYGHGGAPNNPRYQTAYFIPAKGATGIIDRVGIYIFQKHTFLEFLKPSNPVHLYLYKADAQDLPGELLLPEPLIIKPKKNTQWYWVDISEYKVALPEQGLFAAVSWPKATKEDNGPFVGMTNECDSCPFYLYHFPSEPTWLKVDEKIRKAAEKGNKDKMNQNLMVRLEVSLKK